MSLLFSGPGPRLFGAPPGEGFAVALAAGLRERIGASPPEALATVEIAMPTARLRRATEAAFEAAGPAVFLPRLTPIALVAAGRSAGPPPAEPLARRLRLARLVGRLLAARPDLGGAGAALPLGAALGELLDEFGREGFELSRLEGAAPAAETGSEHWRRLLDFLRLVATAWPRLLAEPPAEREAEARRREDVAALLAEWAAAPPARPILAAGSSGSTGATASLIEGVARLPQGAAILAGFDFDLDEAGWAAVGPEHPQWGHKGLLLRLGLDPGAVEPWLPDRFPGRRGGPRTRLLSAALRPAPATDAWLAALPTLAAEAPEAAAGLTLVEAPNAAREADAIALAMREALALPPGPGGGRIVLTTPDRALARRVAAALRRFGLVADDSGGAPLAATPPGRLVALVAELLCRPFDAPTLLALLKHPLAAADRAALKRLERRGLRRRRAALRLGSVAALLAAEEEDGPLVAPPLRPLLAALAPVEGPQPLAGIVRRHRGAAEAVGGAALWEGPAGAKLDAALAALERAGPEWGEAAPADYPALLAAAFETAGEARLPPEAAHPRLAILGPREARGLSADLMILGGLSEGVWPAPPPVDPWLGLPVREAVGLPSPERRVGLSALDFLGAAAAPRAILSRPLRAEGGPAVASRWLTRLTTLLGAADGAALAAARGRGDALLARAAALAAPARSIPPALRPEPRPPAALRPRRLSVTEIETLIRDPYAIYARHVLRLRPMDEPGAAADPRDRGDALHEALERFVGETRGGLPPDAAALFDRIAGEAVAASVARPAQALAWRARLDRARGWLLETEAARRALGAPLALEAKGELALDTAAGPVVLVGKADRVDRLHEGGLAIYDYKTGAPPSARQVAVFAKQLPLLALIAERAGFEGVPPEAALRLAYLALSGAGAGGEAREVEPEPGAAEGLRRLLDAFADEARPYLARAYPEEMRAEGDYEHLSRHGEWTDVWAVSGPAGSEGGA